ncbi:MAG: tetratricopeptide repeat protein [Planctomycetota bacterium]
MRVWLAPTGPSELSASDPSAESALAGDWILRGRALAPHHPSTCLAAAFELMRRGEEKRALEEFDRAVVVGASKGGVVDLLAGDLAKPDLALPFTEGDLALTKRLLGHVQKADGLDELQDDLTQTYEELLIATCARSSAQPGQLAQLASIREERGEVEEAINLYRRLLSVDPRSIQRYDYARLLAAEGDTRTARRQLRDVIQFHPGHRAANNLLAELEGGNNK